jgi:hypothetical protein
MTQTATRKSTEIQQATICRCTNTDFLTITKPLNRKGAFSHWFAQIGDITAYGKSQEEVTTDALTLAKAALSGDYEPVLLFNADHTEYVLCYRTPWQGWSYCIRDIAARVNQGGWTSGFESREECVEYARKHLADNGS